MKLNNYRDDQNNLRKHSTWKVLEGMCEFTDLDEVLYRENHRTADRPMNSTMGLKLQCVLEPPGGCVKTQKTRVSESVIDADAGPDTTLEKLLSQ